MIMANTKESNTKIRILALERLFLTGEPLKVDHMRMYLSSEYGINVDRKTIYRDISALSTFLSIQTVGKGKTHCYILADHQADA